MPIRYTLDVDLKEFSVSDSLQSKDKKLSLLYCSCSIRKATPQAALARISAMLQRKEVIGGKFSWTYAMDECLLNAYIHQQNLGNKQNCVFTSIALDNIVSELKRSFPPNRDEISKRKMKDHMKNLKNKFMPCYNLFKNGYEGFSWNSTTHMWEAESEAWIKLIELKPVATEWRNKPMLFYDKLVTLYGQSKTSQTHTELELPTETRFKKRGRVKSDFVDDIDQFVSNKNLHLENCDGETKRNFENKTWVMFARSLDNKMEAFSKKTNELIKYGQVRPPMLENEIWTILKELEVDNTIFYDAYYFLICNFDAQRAMKGCPPDERMNVLRFLMNINGFSSNN